MVLHIFNPQTLELIGIIDNYSSVIWRPAYYDIGDFEICLPASAEAIQLLQEDYFIARDSDISEENGKIVYKNVMIIKSIQIKTNVEEGNELIITGLELKAILNQRVIGYQTILNCKVEVGIRKLVYDNCIQPKESERRFKKLELDSLTGLTDEFKKQIRWDSLGDAITDICKAYGYGYEIYIKGGKMLFRVYKGLDRSYNQTARPYVVFSNEFDNLYSTDYQLDISEKQNVAIVAGEGEGTARIWGYFGNAGLFDLYRYEMFVDARELSQNKGTSDEIDFDTYVTQLQNKGFESLAECKITEGFSGEIVNDVTFVYGKDYNLGDTVTVINEYGMKRNVMILSTIESIGEDGVTIIPQFNV